MKKYVQILLRKTVLWTFFMFTMISFSAQAQRDILLYTTDMSDWADSPAPSGSGDVSNFSGTGGTGFSSAAKPVVGAYAPAGQKALTWTSSGGTLTFRSFNFVSGGAVVLWVYGSGANNRTFTMPDAAMVGFDDVPRTNSGGQKYSDAWYGSSANNLAIGTSSADQKILDPSKIGLYAAGTQAQISKVGGLYKICFILPTTFTGTKTLTLTGMNKDYGIVGIQVYSGVGTTPYVASTNYAQYPSTGHSLSGSIGGAKYSGTPVNDKIKIEKWNTAGDVTLTIEGDDAAKFSLSNTSDLLTSTITNADLPAKQEKEITIYFTPSVKASVANAKLKIQAAGAANPYYVTLTGITGGTAPQIVADTATIPFWTSMIKAKTQTLDISGLNLTGDITLSVSGAAASRITLSTNTITKTEATSGTSITITYLGDISVGTKTALLTLTSSGADPVKIPLTCVTSLTTPTLYSLTFDVSPAGSAYVNTSPAGTKFLSGTVVTVTVTPETGYTIASWEDVSSNTRTKRIFTVGELKNTDNGNPITITLTTCPGGNCQPCTTCDCDPSYCTSSFVAYKATPDASNSSTLHASWTQASGAPSGTTYNVTLYDENNSVIDSYTTTNTDYTFTGLTPGTLYKYRVQTTVGTNSYDTGIAGPFKTSGTATTFVCGQ